MKQFAFIVLIAVVFACDSKWEPRERTIRNKKLNNRESKERTIYNKEFNWTMTIPAGFESMTKKELDKINKNNAESNEESYGPEGGNMGDNLFGFRRNRSSIFFAKWLPLDMIEEDSYERAISVLNKKIYKGIKAQLPGATLDSFTALENISGMKFPVFAVKATKDGSIGEYMFYRKPFGNKELVVYIGSSDMEDQLDILTAWRNSKFEGRTGKRQPTTVDR